MKVYGDKTVTAVFVSRPGAASLDLVSDLGEFLAAIGKLSDPSKVTNLRFDRGGYTFNGVFRYTANGIPDAVELMLLESILKDATFDLSLSGGVANGFMWQNWEQNRAQAQADLPAQNASIQRAVAAYMTLGYYGIRAWVCAKVLEHFGVELDPEEYANNGGVYFAPDKDCDADGYTNLEEWQYITQTGPFAPQAKEIGRAHV